MGFFDNIFGINKILERIDQIDGKLETRIENSNTTVTTSDSKEIDLNKCESLVFSDPLNKRMLLTIEQLKKEDMVNKRYKEKPIGNKARISSLLQNLPVIHDIAQSNALEGAYKIVMPEGSVGNLMQYTNGTFGTSLISNGKISGHAGLIPIVGISLTPVFVFTAVSTITGQYFMAKINNSLEAISNDVKDIINMFFDDKEAENRAILYFLSYVRDNMDVILQNSDLRLATLTNLQSSLIKLEQNNIFYNKTMTRKKNKLDSIKDEYNTTSKRIDEFEKIKSEIEELIIQQHICSELYIIGKMYEMQLARIYDESYCTKLKNQLNDNIITTVVSIAEIEDKFNKVLMSIEDSAFISKYKIQEQKVRLDEEFCCRQDTFKKNVKDILCSISDFIEFNKREQTFIVQDDNLYYLE